MKHLAQNNFCNLGDVATYINGYAFKPTDWGTEGLPIIRIQDLTGNSYQANCFSGEVDNRFRVHSGDILISWSASLGVYVWEGEKAVLNQHIFKVQFDKVEVDKNFFVHQVERILNNASGEAHGATMKHLTKPVFDSLPFYLPNIEEQKKIANELNKVSNLISLRKQQLAKLDELVKARFIEMFGDPVDNPKGWKKDKAENFIDLLSGFPFDSSKYTESGVNICGGLIIMPQRIEWGDCKHWCSIDGYEEYALNENDIVIALDRPWISEGFKIAMVEAEHLPALLIQRTARIRAIGLNQFYLMYCFLLGGFDKHCNVTGSLVPHISAKDIRSFAIMLPPIDLQEQFAAFVEQTDKSKLEIQKSLEKLEILKKSLMQKYFG